MTVIPVAKIKPPVKVKLLTEDGVDYVGYARQQLAMLTAKREQLGMPVLKKPVIYLDNIWIKIVSSVWGDEILIGGEAGIRGFLFHPRTGPVKELVFAGETREYRYPYVFGTGWDPKGETLPGQPGLYPLADNDHGTRNIEYANGKWKYVKDPPENYGNLDWKGKNTAKDGKPSNAPILTWKGPPSRYFGNLYDTITGGWYFSQYLYQGGEVIGTIPQETADGEPIHFLLGAALTTDNAGNVWKVVVSRRGVPSLHKAFLMVLAQPLASRAAKWYDQKNAPNGWQVLLSYSENSGTAPGTAFFFNASGTEAGSVFYDEIYTVSIDIDGMSASVRIEPAAPSGSRVMRTDDNMPGVTTSTVHDAMGVPHPDWSPGWNADYFGIGEASYESHSGTVKSISSSGAVVAVDYVGDRRVTASISFSYRKENIYHNNSNSSAGMNVEDGSDKWCSWHSETCYSYHWKAKATLCFNGKSITIYSDECTSFGDIHSDDGHNEWDNPDGSGWETIRSDCAELNRRLRMGTILFMDLRSGIVVIAEKGVDSSTTGGGRIIQLVQGIGEWQDNLVKSSVNYLYSLIINDSGSEITRQNWYQSFDYGESFVEDGQMVWTEGEVYPFNAVWFRSSNQPVGSWAVDCDGNRFYSMLVKDGVFNCLLAKDGMTGDVVTLTKTEGSNPIFFPIAPV